MLKYKRWSYRDEDEDEVDGDEVDEDEVNEDEVDPSVYIPAAPQDLEWEEAATWKYNYQK